MLFILQEAWNGSVSHNWADRITRYRDTIAEDCPALMNGAVNMLITENGTVKEWTKPWLCTEMILGTILSESAALALAALSQMTFWIDAC